MLTLDELKKIAKGRLKDAVALYDKRRFDGAAYLCGYSVEVAIKWRIAKTLRWTAGFPGTGGEFSGLQSFKTHDLDMLLFLSGWEDKIKKAHTKAWAIISEWNPAARYDVIGTVVEGDARDMIESARTIVEALL